MWWRILSRFFTPPGQWEEHTRAANADDPYLAEQAAKTMRPCAPRQYADCTSINPSRGRN